MTDLGETSEVLEEVVGEAHKIVDAVGENTAEIIQTVKAPNLKLIAGSTLVVGLAIGAGLGYLVATRRLQTKYSKLAESEIEEMRKYFASKELARQTKPDLDELVTTETVTTVTEVEIQGEMSTPNQTIIGIQPTGDRVVRDVPDYMKNEDGSVTRIDEDGNPVRSHYTDKNIFSEPQDTGVGGGWDYAVELKLRAKNANAPHVIHRDEMGEINDWDCTTYTYYEEDDVLADERDRALAPSEIESMVGEANLKRFGEGSDDPNIVIVRNPRIEQEFEIVKSDQSYRRDVLGLDDDEDALRHYDMPGAGRKQRWDDE